MSESFTTRLSADEASIQVKVKSYLSKVYTWMAVSMLLTAVTAVYAANDIGLMAWGISHVWLLIIGTLAVVLVMSFGRNALSATTLGALFLVFSALEGMCLAPVLAMYDVHSIGLTFACTAGMFGGMAFYGATTQRNLGGMRSFLFMALLGLVIAGVANAFWGNGTADLVISGFGVLVFSIFTAYDMQNLIREGLYVEGEVRSKAAVLGALGLYLDFLNLFLYLLRFLGNRD